MRQRSESWFHEEWIGMVVVAADRGPKGLGAIFDPRIIVRKSATWEKKASLLTLYACSCQPSYAITDQKGRMIDSTNAQRRGRYSFHVGDGNR
jgi:hypothetical protein